MFRSRGGRRTAWLTWQLQFDTLINKYTKNESDQIYNKGYKVDYLLQRSVETLTKKVVSIEFEGKKYVLPDELTLESFLSSLGFDDNDFVLIRPTKDGLSLMLK